MPADVTHGFVISFPCGCVETVAVERLDRDGADTFREVADALKRGLTVRRLPLADVRVSAKQMGDCDACRSERNHVG